MRFISRVLIVLLLPVFLVLASVRVLMTSSFARWEYSKANFPDPGQVVRADAGSAADLASEEAHIVPVEARQSIVDATLAYVKGAGDESLLADLTFDDGRRVYNQREVRHLTDVRVLVRQASVVHFLSSLVLLLSVGFLVWSGRSQSGARALVAGSGLTVGFVGLIGLIAYSAFRFFFVRFHLMFFEGTTWLFPSTDTLIQIFPEKFWFDASLLIVLLTLVEAVVVGVVALAWLAIRRRQTEHRSISPV